MPRTFPCDHCHNKARTRERCVCCERYNAAVAAQGAAALSIAQSRMKGKVDRAWLNEHGIFAEQNGRIRQIGTAEEAEPFHELTFEAVYVPTAEGLEALAVHGGSAL